MTHPDPSGGPLAGVRVVDLGHLWAAPMTTMLLADQGADVVRVLRPGSDEPTRSWFIALHRNKRLVEIDLGSPAGREEIGDLVHHADVVVESHRPGAMARHGLDAASLAPTRPDLVHLALPGFSSVDAARRDLPGWEGVVAAATGLYTTGLRQSLGAPPIFHAMPIPSAFAAAHGAIAIVAALHHRAEHGGGATLEVPLAHAALAACSRSFCFAGPGVRSTSTPHPHVPAGLEGLVVTPADDEATRETKIARLGSLAPPNYSIHHYRASDGRRLLVMPIKPEMVSRYLRVLGIEDEVRAEGYVNESPWAEVAVAGAANLASSWTMSAERNRWLIDRIQAVIATAPSDHWIDVFTAARIPCAAMHTRDEWMARADVVDSGLVASPPGDDAVFVGRFADVDMPGAPPPRFDRPSTLPSPEVVADWTRPRPTVGSPPSGRDPVATKADLLADVRVLDLCNVVAGPNAGYVFAQLGADVIRVEPPTSFNLPMHHAWTLEVNQGKRSVVLDTTTRPGRRALEALVATADVVIHNRLDDVATRLGLTAADIAAVNPQAVLCQISAFGGSRPHRIADQPGYDPHPNLATGLDALLGTPDAPRQAEEILSDLLGGLSGGFAAMCALHARRTVGHAPAARGSLARGTCFLQAPWMVQPAPDTGWPDATGPTALGLSPTYRLYEAADSWIAVAAPGLDAETLADRVGAPTPDGIATAIAARPAAHWRATLAGSGVAAHEVHSIDDLCAVAGNTPVPNEPEDRPADGPIRVVSWPDHPSGVAVVLPEPAWVLVGPDRDYRRLAPTPVVGAHTREVLAEVGYATAAIDELVRLRVAHDHLPAMTDPAAYFFVPREVVPT